MCPVNVDENPDLVEARARLGRVAVQLCQRLDSLDVAGSYLGIAAVILGRTLGPASAAEYLRELAAEIESDQDPTWGGRA